MVVYERSGLEGSTRLGRALLWAVSASVGERSQAMMAPSIATQKNNRMGDIGSDAIISSTGLGIFVLR
jgi:hypothetical protein